MTETTKQPLFPDAFKSAMTTDMYGAAKALKSAIGGGGLLAANRDGAWGSRASALYRLWDDEPDTEVKKRAMAAVGVLIDGVAETLRLWNRQPQTHYLLPEWRPRDIAEVLVLAEALELRDWSKRRFIAIASNPVIWSPRDGDPDTAKLGPLAFGTAIRRGCRLDQAVWDRAVVAMEPHDLKELVVAVVKSDWPDWPELTVNHILRWWAGLNNIEDDGAFRLARGYISVALHYAETSGGPGEMAHHLYTALIDPNLGGIGSEPIEALIEFLGSSCGIGFGALESYITVANDSRAARQKIADALLSRGATAV